MGGTTELQGPDLTAGVPAAQIQDGVPFAGHAQGEAVLVVRIDGEYYAIGATCTHYSGPLAEGIVVGHEVRCPWHHACFSLRTGEAIAPPALHATSVWEVELRGDSVFVVAKKTADSPPRRTAAAAPGRVVILGGGAAGSATADWLRRESYAGEVVVFDHDADAPYDRPNLSKDYLAGSAPEEWLSLWPEGKEQDRGIQRIGKTVASIEPDRKRITLSDGDVVPYGALVIATGAAPVRPPVPGIDLPHVHVLRSLADCRRLIAAVNGAQKVVVAGASFIGMEAAASLRTRGLDVTVVAPEAVPFTKVLGPEIGGALQKLHEQHGVAFRLGRTLASITERSVHLDDGSQLAADVVLVGVGVRPQLDLAQAAGLEIDKGLLVDEYLQTRVPGVYAAGDIARYATGAPDGTMRVEHWVVAQSQGAAVARNILGAAERYTRVPFFWSTHFGTTVNYVGHAERWTEARVDGSPEAGDCAVSLMDGGRLRAYITIGRDRASLEVERQLEASHT